MTEEEDKGETRRSARLATTSVDGEDDRGGFAGDGTDPDEARGRGRHRYIHDNACF